MPVSLSQNPMLETPSASYSSTQFYREKRKWTTIFAFSGDGQTTGRGMAPALYRIKF